MTSFSQGPRALAAGFGIIFRPGVRRYVLIPFSINLILFTTAFAYGVSQVDRGVDWLSSQFTWAEWVAWLLWPVFLLIFLMLLFFFFTILANLLAAPFNGFLAEAVEESLTGVRPAGSGRPMLEEIRTAMRSEASKIGYFAVRALLLLLLSLVPFVTVIAPILWFAFGAWVLSLEYMEFPMANNGLSFPEVRARLREHRAMSMAFGGSVVALTIIPVVNFLVMPVAVAAATKLWVETVRPVPLPPS